MGFFFLFNVGFPGGTRGKESAFQSRRHKRCGFSLWMGNGVGNGNPIQYSCLENSMDRGPWPVQFSSVSQLFVSDSLQPHGLQHTRPPCPSPTYRSLLKLMSIKSVIPSNHLILYPPLLLQPSVFCSIRVFPNESVLPIRWPKYWGFSFSISPSSEYSFRMDGLVGSPCSPKDSHESSPTPQFKSINSLVLSFLYGPTLTSIHDYWKNHSFD